MDEPSGQGDLRDLLEARRKVVAAFEEIAAGAEALALAAQAEAVDPAELARLRAEIEEERVANAQLQERVRALRERQGGREAELERDLAHARDAVAEVEARRAADRAEIDAVLAQLMPLIEEAS